MTASTAPASAADVAFAKARLRAVILEGVRAHGPIPFRLIRRRIAPNVAHAPVAGALKTLREQGLITPTKQGWEAVPFADLPHAPSATA